MRNSHPTFIGIGGSFAGWTTLKGLLTEHPAIVSTLPSLNYFSSKQWVSKSITWYLEGLPACQRGEVVTGEVSVGYMYNPQVAGRIVKTFPDTKLIALVRHPLARAIAEYEYYQQLASAKSYASCSDFMRANPAVVERGRYGQQLARFYSYYSLLELQVIRYEDLATKPLYVAEQLYRFFDIDPTFVPERLFTFAPPEELPPHPSLLAKLKIAVSHRLTEKKHSKLEPWRLPQPNLNTWFTPEELQFWIKEYWSDVIELSDLVEDDMNRYWFGDFLD